MPGNGFLDGEAETAVFSYVHEAFGRPFTWEELQRRSRRDTDRIGTDWAMEEDTLQGALGSLVRKDVLDHGPYREDGFLSYRDDMDVLAALYIHLDERDGWYLTNSFRQDVAEEAVDRAAIDRLAEDGLFSRHGGITYIYDRGWRAMFHAAGETVFEDPYRRAYRPGERPYFSSAARM